MCIPPPISVPPLPPQVGNMSSPLFPVARPVHLLVLSLLSSLPIGYILFRGYTFTSLTYTSITHRPILYLPLVIYPLTPVPLFIVYPTYFLIIY